MKKKIFLLVGIIFIVSIAMVFAILITPFSSNPSGTTNLSSINVSYTIDTDFLNSTIFSWNGTNYTFYDDSLVLFYNFDNRSSLGDNGTVVSDLSRWNQNGTITGAMYNTSGKYNGSLNFTGGTQYVRVLNPKNLSNSTYTVSFWVKTFNDTNTQQNILWFQSDSDASKERLRCQIQTGILSCFDDYSLNNAGSVSNVTANEWHHVVLSYSLTNASFYVDGTFRSFDNSLTTAESNLTDIAISSRLYNSLFLNGSVDDVMIWNRSLSYNESKALYYLSLTKFNSTRWIYNQSSNSSGYAQNYSFCSTNATNNICSSITSIRNLMNVSTNFTALKGSIRTAFYGVDTKGLYLLEGTLIGTGSNSTLDSNSNYTWHQNALTNSGIRTLRMGMRLQHFSSSEGVWSTGNTGNQNITIYTDEVKYAYDNGYKILLVGDGIPDWLANKTSGWCTLSGTNYSCPPSNYTKLQNLVANYIGNITNNGEYCSVIEVSARNEPDSGTYFLNNLSESIANAGIRSIEYNKYYNATYNGVKSICPNAPVGGPTISSNVVGSVPIMEGFLGNFSNQMQFFDFHKYKYGGDGEISNILSNNVTSIYNNCTFYSANCTRIIISEFDYNNAYIQNSTANNNVRGSTIASLYQFFLNNYPVNTTTAFYQWSDLYKYSNTGSFSEYPKKFNMVSEPLLDGEYNIPYNVTKNFAHLCPAGGEVYTSSSDDSDLKVVSCRHNFYNHSVIVINSGTESKNVSLNFSLSNLSSFTDYETGEGYASGTDGLNYLGVMDPYDILYLTSSYECLAGQNYSALHCTCPSDTYYGLNGICAIPTGFNPGAETPSPVVNLTPVSVNQSNATFSDFVNDILSGNTDNFFNRYKYQLAIVILLGFALLGWAKGGK